jgi:hypothetical protein
MKKNLYGIQCKNWPEFKFSLKYCIICGPLSHLKLLMRRAQQFEFDMPDIEFQKVYVVIITRKKERTTQVRIC